ncbi:hypothetical protein F4703DRAFT_1922030 [Phycomyces blakesleeanus]
MTTDTTQISNSSFGPQSHNADPGSHDHTLSGQTLHATLDVWECNIPQWNDQSRLPQQNKHVLFVDASNTRWRCALGDKAIYRYWSHQEATMSINWQEMKANRQHYLNGVPEQAGWLQGLLSDDTDYQDIEAVSAPWVEVDSPAYSRQGECGGGFDISLHIYKELVKAVLSSFSSYLTDMGSSFHGLICSLADPPSPNFCFMETGHKGNILAQDLARVHSGNSSSINLAKCMVVPIAPPDEYRSPSPLDIPGHNSGFPKTSWLLKNPQWRLGVYRVSSVGFKIQDSMQTALKLHRDPTSLRTHKDIHSLFARLAKIAILTQQHKTHMDLTPTLSFLASIPSLASTSLAALA